MPGDLNLDLLVDSANIAILATDASNHVIFLNKHATKFLALDEKETLGLSISNILPAAEPIVKRCKETKKAQSGHKIPGNVGDLIGNFAPILERGQVSGVVCAFLETTEDELSTSKLESYKCLDRELEAVFSSASYGNWLCDGEGTVLKLNEAAEELNGIKAKDIVGKKAWYLVEKGIVDRSVTGEVLKVKHRASFIQHIKKTKKDLIVTATPVFDDKGEIFRVVVNEKDITGLNTLRKELEHSQLVTEKFKNKLSELSMLELKNQQIVVESESTKQVIRIALKLAHMGASDILIQGESGVGKGLLAKFIHKNSSRREEPFMQINCSSLPESLLEAELFGYEKGAFTGARDQGKIGLIELAQNGTLFLDEMGDIPLSIQAKLLSYLDNHTVRPLGGVQEKIINCAIIVATNRDLTTMIKQRQFREDLFYRINSFTVTIPPLRERTGDIFELANFFLQKYNKAYKLKRRLSSRIIKTLQSYPFPGNVRELSSIIKQAVVMSDNDNLDEFILTDLCGGNGKFDELNNDKCDLTAQVRRFEKEMLQRIALRSKSTREMAKYLGINQSTVVRKLKKYGLPGPLMLNGII